MDGLYKRSKGALTRYGYIGFCPRLELDEILHNGCLGYNTDDYEALVFKCSSIASATTKSGGALILTFVQ